MVCESVYHTISYVHMVYIIMFSAYHLSFDVLRGCIYLLHAFRERNIVRNKSLDVCGVDIIHVLEICVEVPRHPEFNKARPRR